MKFFSRSSLPVQPAASFDKVVDDYGWVYDETRKRRVEGVKGQVDIYAKIQAATPGTTLSDMIDKYQKGDMSADALMQLVGQNFGTDSSKVFADVSEMPTNIFELDQVRANARDSYDALPAEVKALFGSDYQTFVNAVLDGSYQQKFKDFEASKKSFVEKVADKAADKPADKPADKAVPPKNPGNVVEVK